MARPDEVAEFLTDLPDGAVEDEGGGPDFLVWPGRPVLEEVSLILVGLGCEVEPIECADFKGWDMGFRYRGRRFWVRVTQIEHHVAYFADPNLWARLIGKAHPLYLELLGRVREALERDPRFHAVRWCTLQAFQPHISDEAQPAGA